MPDITWTNNDEIEVTYHYAKPREALAEASGRTQATFTWDYTTGRVKMTRDVPP